MPTGRAGDWDTSQWGMWTDHVTLIETRSANFIRASGQVPRQQAGHMTAPDRGGNQVKFFLQRRGRPHRPKTTPTSSPWNNQFRLFLNRAYWLSPPPAPPPPLRHIRDLRRTSPPCASGPPRLTPSLTLPNPPFWPPTLWAHLPLKSPLPQPLCKLFTPDSLNTFHSPFSPIHPLTHLTSLFYPPNLPPPPSQTTGRLTISHSPPDAITRLVGAILLEQNDEWAVCRRYMTLETLAQISHPDQSPIQIAAQ